MSETRSFSSVLRRVVLPLLFAAVVVLATLILSGSTMLRIEDAQVNRILAGTYGSPDWRVQEMNPLLAQLLALLYSIIPAVNWYGVLLLAALFAALAAAISLGARRPGGLLPVAVAMSPLALLLTNVLMSTVVSALAAGAGALWMMDGLKDKPRRIGSVALGITLYTVGAMLSLFWTVVVTIAVLVGWLPMALKEKRVRGLLFGAPVMAVLLIATFGYAALMFSSPELSAYRNDYALYQRVLHSNLPGEYQQLLDDYGVAAMSGGEEAHDHDGDGQPDGEHDHEEAEEQPAAAIPDNAFSKIGWSLNDASLLFGRNATDARIVDPAALGALEKQAAFVSFAPGRLFSELFKTLKKPQFLLLILVFVACALALVVTSRNKGLVALMAALFAFGGHIASLARYYNGFADIAPYYLTAMLILVYHFDGAEAGAWWKRALASRWLRLGVAAAVAVGFAGGMALLFHYTANRQISDDPSTLYMAQRMQDYIEANPDVLFVGDNPNERFQPDTLAAPVRGSNKNLLAGSYDLYSPRQAAMKQAYGLKNPLVDSLGREDIGYVAIANIEPLRMHLMDMYGIIIKDATVKFSVAEYGESIFTMIPYTQQELEEKLEQSKRQTEQPEPPAAPEATQVPEATATPDASATPDATAPAAEPTASAAPGA